MFFNSLKPLIRMNLANPSDVTSNIYRAVVRYFGSRPDPCGSKPILMNPSCKNAVVTGGVGGIGYATAHQLLNENAKKVALIGTDIKKGVDAVGYLNCAFGKSKAIFFKCDIRNKDELEDTMKRVKAELEEIDIVVNAAGVWDDVNWQDEMQANLAGTINVTLASQKHVVKGNGVIINLTAFAGLDVFPPSPPFASFASGVIQFSRSIGHDANFKRSGVRVVVLCMGVTQTDILVDVDKRTLTKEMGKDLGEFLKKACSQKPDACAKAVVELVKYGPTGSVWLVVGSRLFYYNVPDYTQSLNLVTQFL